MLFEKPSMLFTAAYSSKRNVVKHDCEDIVRYFQDVVSQIYDELTDEIAQHEQLSRTPSGKKKVKGQSGKKVEETTQNVEKLEGRKLLVDDVMRYVHVKIQLMRAQEYGIPSFFHADTTHKFSFSLEKLTERIQSSRSLLHKSGMEKYSRDNETILKLGSYLKVPDSPLKYTREFLDLVSLWDESDKEDFLFLTVSIPYKTWIHEKPRREYERTLCVHIADAAQVPSDLIDILEIRCPEADRSKGNVDGVALIKFSEYIKVRCNRIFLCNIGSNADDDDDDDDDGDDNDYVVVDDDDGDDDDG